MTALSTGIVIGAGLRGATRLARGHADGLRDMESTPEGAGRSFWVAALCLPIFIALRLLDTDSAPASGRGFVAELIGYALSWVLFPLFARHLATSIGRAVQWPRYIAAWNWCNAIQYVLMLALTVPSLLGASPGFASAISLVVLGYGLWLGWFVARTALGIEGRNAAGFVLLDMALSLLIARVVMTLSLG
ncbi:hypothetical protein [Plastoroseomonas arctica]|uniref:Yip1 domain-containing protein n=1 Tax=Plastoroseomonas arctica TaxID=1509237 RepID=A0AAF1KSI2_9PROT|nr:hypothetical protein [Plastoroseomonas arctica]MBR0654897.1 hypothetical protein [Plastoroseomonas arctica]